MSKRLQLRGFIVNDFMGSGRVEHQIVNGKIQGLPKHRNKTAKFTELVATYKQQSTEQMAQKSTEYLQQNQSIVDNIQNDEQSLIEMDPKEDHDHKSKDFPIGDIGNNTNKPNSK